MARRCGLTHSRPDPCRFDEPIRSSKWRVEPTGQRWAGDVSGAAAGDERAPCGGASSLRASTSAETFAAPARRNTAAASYKVAPVVITSSIRARWRPRTCSARTGSSANAPRMLRSRAARSSVACGTECRTRRSNEPSVLPPASRRASWSDWLKPRSRCRSGASGSGSSQSISCSIAGTPGVAASNSASGPAQPGSGPNLRRAMKSLQGQSQPTAAMQRSSGGGCSRHPPQTVSAAACRPGISRAAQRRQRGSARAKRSRHAAQNVCAGQAPQIAQTLATSASRHASGRNREVSIERRHIRLTIRRCLHFPFRTGAAPPQLRLEAPESGRPPAQLVL